MKYYIAGKFTAKDRLRNEREHLRQVGQSCDSFWMDESYTDYDAPRHVMVNNAQRDLSELANCDALILDTLDESNTGGREVELGWALSRSMPFILIGPERNIFHYLANAHYDSWETLWQQWDVPTAVTRE